MWKLQNVAAVYLFVLENIMLCKNRMRLEILNAIKSRLISVLLGECGFPPSFSLRIGFATRVDKVLKKESKHVCVCL